MTSAQYSSITAAGAVTGAAVVVDVMRAFTTAAWALHLGVDRVVLTGDPDHALYLKRFRARWPARMAHHEKDSSW